MVQGGSENRYKGSQVGRSRSLRDLMETHKAGVKRAREKGVR